jgi:Protein of unknown function (DUF2911)
MQPRHKLLASAALAALLLGTCAVSGVSLLPVQVALGPCLKDWTSGVSYHKRASPLAGERFTVGDANLELCYGRPAARGRPVFGQLVPWATLWRLGANEPTRLYLDHPIQFGTLLLPAGRYSLYTSPGPEFWTVYVTRDILHWGNDISPAVRSREIGHTTALVEGMGQPVETLTIAPDRTRDASSLVIRWERTLVAIPLAPAPAGSR